MSIYVGISVTHIAKIKYEDLLLEKNKTFLMINIMKK